MRATTMIRRRLRTLVRLAMLVVVLAKNYHWLDAFGAKTGVNRLRISPMNMMVAATSRIDYVKNNQAARNGLRKVATALAVPSEYFAEYSGTVARKDRAKSPTQRAFAFVKKMEKDKGYSKFFERQPQQNIWILSFMATTIVVASIIGLVSENAMQMAIVCGGTLSYSLLSQASSMKMRQSEAMPHVLMIGGAGALIVLLDMFFPEKQTTKK